MNPNLVRPDRNEISRIEKDALGIAFWEENWEITNERRVRQGGADYSIFNCKRNPDRKFAADRMLPGEPAYFRRKAL